MAGALIEVKYFNNFSLRKINSDDDPTKLVPVWDGSRGIPASIGGYPHADSTTSDQSWVIEESRIRGGYNNTSLDYGVKAYLVEEDPKASFRVNSLIYSGVFNSRTGINRTNVFSVGEDITKSADPANGSIQKLYAEDTNLTVFQENKVSRALIDKDAIYSAEGGGSITSSNLVIGTIQPYAGQYGISKNPESFAVFGYQKYFSDKNNNAIMRLSSNGLQDISVYGMRDFFRDSLNSIDTKATGPGRVIGGYDIHNDQYVVSLQTDVGSNLSIYDDGYDATFKTLSFDEQPKGWTSFFSYKPDQMFKLRNKFYTVKTFSFIGSSEKRAGIFEHYSSSVSRGTFYEVNYPSSVTFIFNPSASNSKSFQTIAYEGSNGWQCDSIISDEVGSDSRITGIGFNTTNDTTNRILSYYGGEYVINPANNDAVSRYEYTSIFATSNPPYSKYYAGFNRKENKYVSNLINNSSATTGEVIWGNSISGIKGFYATVTLSTDSITDVGGEKSLFAVESTYTINNGY